jgi:hypothetical protein
MTSGFRVRRRAAAAAITLVLLAGAPGDAAACSICRCGDPMFNALGANVYQQSQFALSFDWNRYSKSQLTTHDEELGTEEEVENRYALTASYSFAERFIVSAQIPLSHRDLTKTFPDETEFESTTGLSDPEFYAAVRLWSSNFALGLGRRAWFSAGMGVKTPWGENDVEEDGVRLDEHAQPGTGATNLFGRISGLYLFDERSALFSSVQYTGTGRNEFGYKYGDAVFANLAYERKLSEVLDAVLELNYRFAERDQESADEADPNTGGTVLYVTPRLLVNVFGNVILRAGAQIPVLEDLYGVQDEDVNYNAGLTILF